MRNELNAYYNWKDGKSDSSEKPMLTHWGPPSDEEFCLLDDQSISEVKAPLEKKALTIEDGAKFY